ncbi:MAG: hypothetical protein K9H48_06835, partial [Melioribacteraceae bacterium]|nr:hypothetical protein [Melioribacteraceae bacterium]
MFSLKSNKLFRYSVMLTFLLFAQIQAQAPDILWSKSYGGLGDDWISQSIVPTPEGGFIMTGWYSRDSSDTDVWLLKTNADGDTLWTKTFGGSAIDYGSDIVITSEGDFVIAGITESFGAGEDDWWLIKTDADGNEIWNRTFGGAEDDEDISISKTTDNGYILTGQHAVSADGQVRLLKV